MKKTISIFLLTLILCTPAFADMDGTTSVKDTVQAAVKHHPRIKAMLGNRDALARNLSASLGRFFPSLNLNSSFGFQQYNSQATRGADHEDRINTASDTTLRLTQNIFDGMERINDYLGSEARLESAEGRLIDNVETIGLDAIRAHIDVVRQRKLVTMAEENIVSHQDVLESIVARVEGGAGSKADEMQARSRVARAETTLITYTGDLQTANAAYVRDTGNQPGPLAEPLFALGLVPENMDAVMETTMASNPKIKIFKAELEAIRKDENVTGSSMYPDVDIELSSRNTNQLDGSETYLQDNRAMLAMSWNLFNGGSDYNSIQAAKARVREAESDLQNTVDDLTSQVAVAWTEYQTSIGQIAKYQEALQYSIESRDMYLMQFNVGQRSLLDVLDSINEVFSNRVLLETAQSNRTFALFRFLALEGQLVNNLDIAQASYDPGAR